MKVNVVVVMPAYNAEKTIVDTYAEIPEVYKKHVILVDDGSSDNTIKVAKNLGISVFLHGNNLGYGANQKTCYAKALLLNPQVVVMLHPDYQYDATKIDKLVKPILQGDYDFVFGSRIATRNGALDGGMPKIKYFINRVVCILQNMLLGQNFSEYFSGFRAYSFEFLKNISFQNLSNDFVFDQQIMLLAIHKNYRVGEVPIPTRYHTQASSIGYLKGGKFLIETFWNIILVKLGLLS